MTKKLLTVSVPTWNRCKLVMELLNDLIDQVIKYDLSEDIEILVSNNDSEDNTHETVLGLTIKYPFITYNKNETNIGGAHGVIKSIELANSEYLIFLGDDDRIKEGSLKRIIDFLKDHTNAGVVIDSNNFKKKPNDKSEFSLSDLLKNYYWNIGNAGVFIVKASYVKESINMYGLKFFNQCWPQTQFMILGLTEHKSDKIFIDDLNIISHSVHGEVTIYNSFYLWMSTIYDLFRSIKDLEPYVDKETYQAGREYLKNNIVQLLFNFLQCGVYIDEPEIRKKTRDHIIKHIKIFSPYERKFFWIAVVTLSMPTFLSRFLCTIFILLLKGRTGIIKKNYFVQSEKNKREKAKKAKSIDVRILEFSNEN